MLFYILGFLLAWKYDNIGVNIKNNEENDSCWQYQMFQWPFQARNYMTT